MTNIFTFANNATTVLAGPIAVGALSMSVAPGTGSLFPAIAVGQQFSVTLRSQANPLTVREIVYCTARTTDTFTIVRGQEGTIPTAFIAGDFVDQFLTAGALGSLIQATQLQQQAGNYGIDTGLANAYAVTFNPGPASLTFLIGVPLRILIANTNTGPSTLSVNGLAVTTIVYPNGTQLAAGALVAGGVADIVYTGTAYNVVSISNQSVHGSTLFLTIGTSSFSVPSWVNQVYAEVWGAGGGASGGVGGCGGGGGYAAGWLNVTPNSNIPVVIGAGGAGANNGAQAGTGGSSSFLTLSAGGGGGASTGGTSGGNGAGSAVGGALLLRGGGGPDLDSTTSISYGIGGAAPRGGFGGWINAAGSGINPTTPGGGGGGNFNFGAGQAGAQGAVYIQW